MAINKQAPGATPLDPDEANDLIPSHITTKEQLKIGGLTELGIVAKRKGCLKKSLFVTCTNTCSEKHGNGQENSERQKKISVLHRNKLLYDYETCLKIPEHK